jgi:hypothetical protein
VDGWTDTEDENERTEERKTIGMREISIGWKKIWI